MMSTDYLGLPMDQFLSKMAQHVTIRKLDIQCPIDFICCSMHVIRNQFSPVFDNLLHASTQSHIATCIQVIVHVSGEAISNT